MFTAFNERNDFSYAFEKIRNAISAPGENNVYAATELGLDDEDFRFASGIYYKQLHFDDYFRKLKE